MVDNYANIPDGYKDINNGGPPEGAQEQYSFAPVPVPVSALGRPTNTQPNAFKSSPRLQHHGLNTPNVEFVQPPIFTQPTQQQNLTTFENIPINVPQGLECLVPLDKIIVKQKLELVELLCNCETNNKYKIKDPQGKDIFKAEENTDCCTRNCCGKRRPFDMKIHDMSGREIIHLARPLRCGTCWFPCCLQSIKVYAPPDELAGSVEQEWSLCFPKFSIKDASGNVVLRIEGPFCTCSCCGSVKFEVLSADGSEKVGQVSKKWSGLLTELVTDADNFGISFPVDLDVKIKAVMLGACMLIDFMYFEQDPGN